MPHPKKPSPTRQRSPTRTQGIVPRGCLAGPAPLPDTNRWAAGRLVLRARWSDLVNRDLVVRARESGRAAWLQTVARAEVRQQAQSPLRADADHPGVQWRQPPATPPGQRVTGRPRNTCARAERTSCPRRPGAAGGAALWAFRNSGSRCQPDSTREALHVLSAVRRRDRPASAAESASAGTYPHRVARPLSGSPHRRAQSGRCRPYPGVDCERTR